MKFKPLLRMFKLVPKLRKWAWAAGILMVLEGISAPATGELLRRVMDTVFSSQADTSRYGNLVIATLVLVVALSLVALIRTRVLAQISERGAGELRRLAVDSLLEMPVSKLDTIHTGDQLSRLTNDAGVVRHYLYFQLFWLFSLPLGGILGLAYLFYLDWVMTLILLAIIPVSIIITAKVSKPVEKISGQLQESLALVNNSTQDALGGAEVVKAYNLQDEMQRRQDEAIVATIVQGRRLARQQAFVRMCSVASGFIPFFLPLAIGGWFVVTGRMTPGSVIAFMNMINTVSHPLSRLPHAMSEHQKATAAFERLYELIDQPRERQNGEVFSNGQEVILEAKDITFAYNSEPILKGLSFHLQRGETVALVGPSGAGKTTVFKVLVGFYPPQQGQVLLYNQPLDKWKLSAARRQMAMVSQDTFLFPGTIAENIALGKPDASRDEIEAAAIQANAHEFIVQLPNGYDHVLEERGANLSGGQRQRLSLARAILLDAPLLLLDEATSALDTESERLVQDALDKMAASRTTLVIAHRLSTIRNADRILVIDEGRIVEEGKHQELLDRGGLYRQLYLRQLSTETETGGVA
jgi:ABC-type multidrug transport system fused ATPase/permease subunit